MPFHTASSSHGVDASVLIPFDQYKQFEAYLERKSNINGHGSNKTYAPSKHPDYSDGIPRLISPQEEPSHQPTQVAEQQEFGGPAAPAPASGGMQYPKAHDNMEGQGIDHSSSFVAQERSASLRLSGPTGIGTSTGGNAHSHINDTGISQTVSPAPNEDNVTSKVLLASGFSMPQSHEVNREQRPFRTIEGAAPPHITGGEQRSLPFYYIGI